MKLHVAELHKLKCRFGCGDPPVGIFHVPQGCVCFTDPLQALCLHHSERAQSEGPITCLLDFRMPKSPALQKEDIA
jgi:hypothetical protein